MIQNKMFIFTNHNTGFPAFRNLKLKFSHYSMVRVGIVLTLNTFITYCYQYHIWYYAISSYILQCTVHCVLPVKCRVLGRLLAN